MGCDIHAYIEYKFSDNNFTEVISDGEISFGRDYELFGILAGVRGMNKPIISPRGFPTANNSPMPPNWYVSEQYFKYIDSHHSATWLTLDELKRVRSEYLKEMIIFNNITDAPTKALINNKVATNDVFTYTFAESENMGLYCSIVLMESLQRLHKNIETRFVCWFDS